MTGFGQDYAASWGDALAACESEEQRDDIESIRDLSDEELNSHNKIEVEDVLSRLWHQVPEILEFIRDTLRDMDDMEGYVSEEIVRIIEEKIEE